MLSKLSRGNTYVLKQRDDRNVVVALHVLDPTRVQPLVADDGAVFYRLSSGQSAGIGEITVPAREIIHDRMNCLFHPLCRHAAGVCHRAGLDARAQRAEGIRAAVPERLDAGRHSHRAGRNQRRRKNSGFKEQWETRFSRVNLGRVAMMTGGAKYEKMAMTNVEGQMVENLKWSAEVVC